MMRALCAIALVACSDATSATPDGGPQDAGLQLLGISLLDNPVVVVRGQTTTVTVRVVAPQSSLSEAVIAFGPLPPGLSSTTTTWHGPDVQDIVLSLTAAPDAPVTELTFEVRAGANGRIVGSAHGVLDVSNTTGSLDRINIIEPDTPSFGGGIARTSDGGFAVAGITLAQKAFLARLQPDGTQQSFIASPTAISASTSFVTAFSADGHVAIAGAGNSGGSVVVLDANGNLTSSNALGQFPECVAWDGDAVLVCQTRKLIRIDAANHVTSFETGILGGALLVPAPGTVLVGGEGMTSGEIAAFDTTSGTKNTSWDLASVSAMTLDEHGLILAAAPTVQRFLPNGVLQTRFAPVFTPSGSLYVAILPLSGDTVVVGNAFGFMRPATVLARFDSSGALVGDFGTFGHAFSTTADGLAPHGAVLDATGTHVCTSGTKGAVDQPHAYVACYRLTP